MEDKYSKGGRLVEIKKGQTGTGLLIENDGYVSSEVSEHNRKVISETLESRHDGEWNVPNPFILDAVLQKYGIENANKRIYPEDVLKREVARYQKLIDQHMALGECNHPAESSIDLGRVSHNIIECHWEGHTLVGKLELNLTEGFRRYGICSSLGDTCANLIINGYKIGISSRAIGSVVTRMGKNIVSSDMEIISWDLVATPSTPGSYVGNLKDLLQYVESDEAKNDKPKLQEKINRISKLLA